MQTFDAIIIGSGQAGTPLAFKLAAHKKRVAFIEKKHLGGTCLNVGCTPTKTYVASARRMWDAQHGEELGIHIPDSASADLPKIKARKDDLIQKSVDGITKRITNSEYITFFEGEAHFEGHKIVEVNGAKLTAEEVYINVGGRPFIPNGYEGLPYLTNETLLELGKLPEHLIIVGGSYIGLEFGQMFRRFGSQVTIIEMADTIIAREDKETSIAVQRFMEDEGIAFRLKAECLSADMEEDGTIAAHINCAKEGAVTIKGSHILLAVGRRPNTGRLELNKTGIETDSRGFIPINDYLETNVPGIYALGDCNGKGAFTHTAYNDYEIVAENKLLGKTRKVSDRIPTYGLFVDPPLGRVGMTQKEAMEKGLDILVGHRSMSSIARAKEKGETNGYMSVVVDAKSHKILGATVLGTGGDEIISTFVYAMHAGLSYETLRDSVQPHPTVNELIPTMLGRLSKP
nr:mercuric reductase [Phaeodactylibacter xiamenensis]